MFGNRLAVGLCAALLVLPVAAANPTAEASAADASRDEVFARINDLTITRSEFAAIFQAAVRQKYYHGKVMESELAEFREQVVEDIITQELVFREAKKKGLRPDRAWIDASLDAFEIRNANSPDWEARRDKIIPRLLEQLERQDLIEQVEADVRDLPRPDGGQVEAYYLANPQKFTEPERLWVSVILRNVSPASGEPAWVEAEAELGLLKDGIDSLEDFAEFAGELSDHPSAVNDGDLGYLHQGVLVDNVQQALQASAVGQVVGPLRVLEGVALFRLNGVQPEALRAFPEVRERAADLLYQEMQDSAWESYVDALRSSANVYVND